MKKSILSRIIIAASCLLIFAGTASACTVGVVSGNATADGRPLLWKNRDSGFRDNEVLYFKGPRYEFFGVINTGDSTQVWMGLNSAGLAIMNSESRDLPGDRYDDEGRFMKHVLGNFATVAEVARYLEETNESGRAVTSNFGVIDGEDGAGFFETGNHSYTFFDANTAPDGFLVRANFAETGNGDGYGYFRCDRAKELIQSMAERKQVTHKYMLQTVSRDIRAATCDPYPLETTTIDTVPTRGTVNRHRTVSVAVFHGVKKGENPYFATMWTILGEPVAGLAVPLWVATAEPGKLMHGNDGARMNRAIQGIENQIYTNTADPTVINPQAVAQVTAGFRQLEDGFIHMTDQALREWRLRYDYARGMERLQNLIQQTSYELLNYRLKAVEAQ